MNGEKVCEVKSILLSGIKMRVCDACSAKHIDTLTSQKEGTEYDLCQECLDAVKALILMRGNLVLKSEKQPEKRGPCRPKRKDGAK
jgi:hypothetical protein